MKFLVLNAKIVLQGKKQRVIDTNKFFKSYRRTSLKGNEFIKEIKIPILNKHILKCYKISKRLDDDISSVFVAYLLNLKKNLITDIQIAFGGMSGIPKFANKTQKFLKGKEFNLTNLDKSQKFIEEDFKPLSDMRASSEYRKLVSKNLIKRFFIEVKTNKSHTIESS